MTAQVPGPQASTGGGMFFFCGLLIAAVAVGLVMTARIERQAAPADVRLRAAVPQSVKSIHASNSVGLHNVYRLGESLYTGSSPDEEGAFESLARLGVKTIISVDGAVPDVEAARAHGMRYVHLPITYGSVPHETLVDLVRASRELPGSIYLHCHHGKHRGPAAAVSLWRCLDKHVTPEQAVATMKVIGTGDQYQGLFESARDLACPTDTELSAEKSDLPEISPVPPLARTMAEIDRMWDRVAVPVEDRNTTTISMQLTTAYDVAEQFREAARLADVAEPMQPGFREIVDDLERLADVIKAELRSPAKSSPERAAAVAKVKQRCDDCHAKFRN
ncbi:MAG: hypothetical protein JSS49_16555 [Planctomycetes bacterium]|nr:hypothetical protein [Planctomycetota bacterium]